MKTNKNLAWCLAALALTLSMAGSEAATSVCGSIVGQTWTKDKSPYNVTCDVVVGSLTIEPGVRVLVQGDYAVEIDGTITAQGTAAEPIVFARESGGWQGLWFRNSYDTSNLRYCIISNAVNSGVRVTDCGPLLEHCWIGNNSNPSRGGGILVSNAPGTGPVRLRDCVIQGNSSNPSQSAGDSAGGGVYVVGGGEFVRCEVTRNSAYGFCHGYWGCESFGRGGGVYANGPVSMVACTVSSNTVYAKAEKDLGYTTTTAHALGSGVYADGGVLSLENSIVSDNTGSAAADSVEVRGGGIFVAGGTASLANCTVVYNSVGGVDGTSGIAAVTNSIIYFNSGTQIGGVTAATYSDVQGGFSGIGNLSCNPLLARDGGFKISSASCCVDAGDPEVAYNDVCYPPSLGNARSDIGAHGGPGACYWIAGDAPSIVENPRSQSGCLEGSVTFAVMATGAEPLYYQWYFKGTPLDGETHTTLVVSDLRAEHAGTYSVVVSNVYATAQSTAAELVVNDACLDIHMYAGLSVLGKQGSAYVLSYNTDLSDTAGWIPLATNVMSSGGWFYLDMDSPFASRRFYRAVLSR